jgi:hypothetical protein
MIEPLYEEAVDGFTWAELYAVRTESIVCARCTVCAAEHDVEPDATDYDCQECGAKDTVTSPLVKVGLL